MRTRRRDWRRKGRRCRHRRRTKIVVGLARGRYRRRLGRIGGSLVLLRHIAASRIVIGRLIVIERRRLRRPLRRRQLECGRTRLKRWLGRRVERWPRRRLWLRRLRNRLARVGDRGWRRRLNLRRRGSRAWLRLWCSPLGLGRRRGRRSGLFKAWLFSRRLRWRRLTPRRGRHRPRLNAFTRTSEDRLRVRRRKGACRRRLRRSSGRLALQRADGALECQPEAAEHLCRDALAIANDGGEHDRAVDFAPAASPRGSSGGLEDASHIGGDEKLAFLALRTCRQHREVPPDLSCQLGDIDIARGKNQRSVGIVAQRQEHMLEGYLGMALRARIVCGPRQRRGQPRRHGNTAQAVGIHLRATPGRKIVGGEAEETARRRRVE